MKEHIEKLTKLLEEKIPIKFTYIDLNKLI